MTQAEFDKITIGSIVGFVAYPQFTGIVLAKYVDTSIEPINMVVVDLPSNTITNGYDPKPQPIKAEYLTVVEYADTDSQEYVVPEAIKVAVDHWITYTESLLDEMENLKDVWFS